MGELRESVQRAFAEFVKWRSYIIKAFIDDGKLFKTTIVEDKPFQNTIFEDKPFQNTIFVERERSVLQIELDDELAKLLPRSTMPLNVTTCNISDMDWIYTLCKYFDGWLVSIALKLLGHDDRKLLVKEIKKLSSICQVVSSVGMMKYYVHCRGRGDNQCDVCGEFASSVYWKWCCTCKDDKTRKYCNFCEGYYDQCQSCCSDFAEVVRCSDKFCYGYFN